MRNMVLAVTALAVVVSAAGAQNPDWGNKLLDPDGKGLLFTIMRETASEFEPRVV